MGINIPHHFPNGLYLGGPHDPTEEHLALLKAHLEKVKATAPEAGETVQITGYVAQKSYVTGGTQSNRVMLPATPIEGTDPEFGTYPVSCTTAATGTNLLACIENANFSGTAEHGKMWSAAVVSDGYLEAFLRGDGKDVRYNAQSTYYNATKNGDTYVKGEKVPKGQKLQPNQAYIWEGWGVMYAPKKGVPTTAGVDVEGGYPLKTLAEQTITEDNKVFTFVYAETAYGFVYGTDEMTDLTDLTNQT